MKKDLPASSGFTLIELLVVITILAILAMLGLAVFSGVQGRGRDAVRRSVVNNVANAIESKRNNNGSYTFTTTDLANEFPDDLNAKVGKDPSDYPYCVDTSTSSSTVPSPISTSDTNWTLTECTQTADYDPLATAVTGGATLGILADGTARSWTLCAKLEAGTNVYCRSSLTR